MRTTKLLCGAALSASVAVLCCFALGCQGAPASPSGSTTNQITAVQLEAGGTAANGAAAVGHIANMMDRIAASVDGVQPASARALPAVGDVQTALRQAWGDGTSVQGTAAQFAVIFGGANTRYGRTGSIGVTATETAAGPRLACELGTAETPLSWGRAQLRGTVTVEPPQAAGGPRLTTLNLFGGPGDDLFMANASLLVTRIAESICKGKVSLSGTLSIGDITDGTSNTITATGLVIDCQHEYPTQGSFVVIGNNFEEVKVTFTAQGASSSAAASAVGGVDGRDIPLSGHRLRPLVGDWNADG